MKFLYLVFTFTFLVFFFGCSETTNLQPNTAQSNIVRSSNGQSDRAQSSNQTGLIVPVSITASESNNPTELPSKAFDGDLNTIWNAGGGVPQWIQFDLGQLFPVSKLRLNVTQSPVGQTVHEVYGGESLDKLSLLGKLEGNTEDGQWLEMPISGNNVRYFKIITTVSPSWVSWREIQILK